MHPDGDQMETVHVIALTREEARERMNESVKYQRRPSRRVAIDRRDRRRVNAFGQESGGAVGGGGSPSVYVIREAP